MLACLCFQSQWHHGRKLFDYQWQVEDSLRNKVGEERTYRNYSAAFSSHSLFFPFSGYEGVSEFFTDLLNHIAAVLQGQAPEVTQLNRSKLLAEQTGGMMDERICCASTGCLSVMGKDSSWIVESETNSSVKLQHQRLGCNSAVSPSFQQHCVATLATKASSQ